MKKVNDKGVQLICKFCGKPVWFNESNNRWYEPGGEEFHVKSCEKSEKFYREQAYQRQEARRRMR